MSASDPVDAATIAAAASGAKGVRVVYPVLPLPGVDAALLRTTDADGAVRLRIGTAQDVAAVETVTALAEAVRRSLGGRAPVTPLVVEIATIE